MECSNRGLCDRASGECLCFDGYTGTACQRMQCPEGCSDHGICQTVKDYDATYTFWDRNMARSCKCDPGYTGVACQTRQCPFGNDPLTKTNEVWETQYVDIYSGCEGTVTTDCGTFGATTAQLGGYARLSYTDHYGEKYTTDPFGVTTMDAGTAALAVATNAQAALRALPNDVTSDTLTVTAQFCEVASDDPTITITTGVATGVTDSYRIIGGTAAEASAVVKGSDATTLVAGTSGYTVADVATPTDGDFHLAILANPMCIRLKIEFVDMPGNLNDLQVDHSDVTYFGESNDQDGSTKAQVSSSVTSDLSLTETTLEFGYTRPYSVSKTGTSDVTISVAASTITFATADSLLQGVTNNFYPNTKIKIECQYTLNGGTQYRNLGIYTVSATTVPTTTVLTVDETIVANTCTVASSTVRITSISNVITAQAYDVTKMQEYGLGQRVKFSGWTGDATIASAEFHSAANSAVKGYFILTGGEGDIAGDTLAAAATTLKIHGDGTRENVECSDRGLCQEDGTCKCFAGYTGDACSTQKSIVA